MSLFVKLISSDPILISPEAGKAEVFANTTVVVASSGSVVDNVEVAGPLAVPLHSAVPQPKPPNC